MALILTGMVSKLVLRCLGLDSPLVFQKWRPKKKCFPTLDTLRNFLMLAAAKTPRLFQMVHEISSPSPFLLPCHTKHDTLPIPSP